ncbi:hypothetical protein V866_008626 [Kwoniella sp. B9012]
MAAQNSNGTHVTDTQGSDSEIHTLPHGSTAKAVDGRIWMFWNYEPGSGIYFGPSVDNLDKLNSSSNPN